MPWLGSRFSSGLARGPPIMGVRGETLHRVKRPFPGGVGNSLLAIVSTRRPSQDSISANAELVHMWARCRCVGGEPPPGQLSKLVSRLQWGPCEFDGVRVELH